LLRRHAGVEVQRHRHSWHAVRRCPLRPASTGPIYRRGGLPCARPRLLRRARGPRPRPARMAGGWCERAGDLWGARERRPYTRHVARHRAQGASGHAVPWEGARHLGRRGPKRRGRSGARAARDVAAWCGAASTGSHTFLSIPVRSGNLQNFE
jgi:hypothetical protein